MEAKDTILRASEFEVLIQHIHGRKFPTTEEELGILIADACRRPVKAQAEISFKMGGENEKAKVRVIYEGANDLKEVEKLRVDLMYLAKRYRIIEDAVIRIEDALFEFNKSINEWSEFMTTELLKQGIRIHKNKRSFEYFRSTLGETHKQNYEKFESLFLKIKQLFGERKRWPKYKLINIYREDVTSPNAQIQKSGS